ncbi:MAG: hypothetical protein RL708_177 [Bacteroidota bacterium]|jgi:hypothetical protein
MTGFIIKTNDNQTIRFNYYNDAAPISVAAFHKVLPFTLSFYHARTSGQEFWIANAFEFDIIQENASVFTEQGEIVLGTLKPSRVKTSGAIGIYYGEGKGLDAANIFGKVVDEDLPKLKALGEKIWKQGEQEITFEKLIN